VTRYFTILGPATHRSAARARCLRILALAVRRFPF